MKTGDAWHRAFSSNSTGTHPFVVQRPQFLFQVRLGSGGRCPWPSFQWHNKLACFGPELKASKILEA